MQLVLQCVFDLVLELARDIVSVRYVTDAGQRDCSRELIIETWQALFYSLCDECATRV